MATIDSRYIYSLGRVKELEKGLLTPAAFDRLLDSDDPAAVLRSVGFFSAPDELDDDASIADIFRRERARNRALLHELIADSPLEDVFLLPYDIQNLKLLLKGKLSGSAAGKDAELETGKYPQEALVELVYNDLPSDLPTAVVDDVRRLTDAFQQHPRLGSIDECLDRRLRAWQFEIARKAGNAFVMTYLQHCSDVQNISAAIRLKTHEIERERLAALMLEGGAVDADVLQKLYDSGWETMPAAIRHTGHDRWVSDALNQIDRPGFLAILDVCAARHLSDVLRTARQHTFGIEQILAFYLARDHELKAARTLWAGQRFGCSREKLRVRNRI